MRKTYKYIFATIFIMAIFCISIFGIRKISSNLSDKAITAVNYNIKINTYKPKFDISPTLNGLFFEDINHAADGGVYSELIKNNSFEYDDKLEGWGIIKKGDGSEGELKVINDQPLNPNNLNYSRLTVAKGGNGVGIYNSGYKGITVGKNKKYDFYLWAKSLNPNMNLQIQIEGSDGKVISDVKTISTFNAKWEKYDTVLTTSSDDKNARLVVYTKDMGVIDMDMVSLFPQDTWGGVKYGLRKDLIQMLYDMKPKFLRFPGGCIVEGKDKEDMYEWKDTIGKIEERKLNKNLWGYYQSYGLGFYEYFKLCEDIGAEPLPVVNAGMTCQVRGSDGVSNYMTTPGEDLNKYIQDSLDLIEYANGPATSTWGAKRAESGHVAPFNLKHLAVGNEQWGLEYYKRFEQFEKAIKEKYPNIQLITGSGTVASGGEFDSAWQWVKDRGFKGLVDEHYYMAPEWFLLNTNRYDSYDRNGAKVFLGEYAAQNPDKKSDIYSALTEAAYMTGLEKNSDVVSMASFAPLFGKENDSQWKPDMIWFNGNQVYGTPTYYVQKLFSTNTGNKLLDLKIDEKEDSNLKLYAVSSLDEKNSEIIIKVVNITDSAKIVKFNLLGADKSKLSGEEIKLTSDEATDENSFVNPKKVSPVTKKIEALAPNFNYKFDKQSLTIIRLKVHK